MTEKEKKEKVNVNDVIQVNPEAPMLADKLWLWGVYATVISIREWGVVAEIPTWIHPKDGGKAEPAIAPIRLVWEEFEIIGQAVFILKPDENDE